VPAPSEVSGTMATSSEERPPPAEATGMGLHYGSWHLQHHLRPRRDDLPEDWWFASIAIPLLSATIGPLANVLSIAALVSYWREDLDDGMGGVTTQLNGVPIKDPKWATGLNVASLVTGYVGNAFLFFNMTNRVRYLVALPMTIFLWICSSMIVSLTLFVLPAFSH